MQKRISLIFLLAVLSAGVVRADDDDVIQYRQLIMKQLDAKSAALGMIVAGQIPPDAIVSEARSLAESAKALPKAFEEKIPGGNAKPEVWSHFDDFQKRIAAFVKKADDFAKVSETKDLSKIGEAIVEDLPCKECHDTYRVPKKDQK